MKTQRKTPNRSMPKKSNHFWTAKCHKVPEKDFRESVKTVSVSGTKKKLADYRRSYYIKHNIHNIQLLDCILDLLKTGSKSIKFFITWISPWNIKKFYFNVFTSLKISFL